jgi:hypothetical protein
MRLTKKQHSELSEIRRYLKRGVSYLSQPDIVGIAQEVTSWPNGGDYTIRNPEVLKHSTREAEHIRLLNKDIGSDMALIYTALQELEAFLANN